MNKPGIDLDETPNSSSRQAAKKCLINDELVGVDRANISVFDHGLTVGDGVFETLKVENGQAFALSRHTRRLARSAEIIGLPELDQAKIQASVSYLLQAQAEVLSQLARLRITYTAGPGPLGSDRSFATPMLAIVWDTLTPSPLTAQLSIAPWPRPTRAAAMGAKTTSYIENVLALRLARQRDCNEALLLNDAGVVCEGTGSNIMAVFDGVVTTPPLTDGCLAGVTRELVIEWFNVKEASISVNDLLRADEVFLTSTIRDIQPVDQIDDVAFQAPGLTSARLREQFITRAKVNPDP